MSTSISTVSTPAAPKSRTSQSRAVRIGVAIGAGLLLLIVGFIVIRTQGFVSGSEFSPTHFQLRDFSFYEIPLLHLQITPINRSGTTPKTATYLRQNSLIPPVAGTPDVWHLVSISRGLTGATPADANLLVEQLRLTDGSDQYWRKWSVDHPEAAKLLWPVVARLAERELYILIPRLMEIAQPLTKPGELESSINEYLKSSYSALIEDLSDAGRDQLAEGLLEEAKTDFPDDDAFHSMP